MAARPFHLDKRDSVPTLRRHHHLLDRANLDGYLRLGPATGMADTLLFKQARTTTHYVWRTRRDGRVRPSHAANDGKIFAWDNPPPTGHPGYESGCRCVAMPYAPPVNEHMRMLFFDVSGWWPGWHSQDFVNHYYFGRGRTVRLRDTGHLERVVNEYWRRRGGAVLGQIASEARKNPGGFFRHTFGRSYSMTNVVFSLGSSTIGGDALGASEWRSNNHLNISGQCNFFLRDEFIDPLDIGVESPLSYKYKIVDDWMGLFSGTIHIDRDRSQYGWRE